jgi:hypothetical protein
VGRGITAEAVGLAERAIKTTRVISLLKMTTAMLVMQLPALELRV